MLEEIAIGPVLTTQTGTQVVTPTPVAAPSATTTATSAYVSPSPDLNPQVGIVVIQYRDQSGNFQLSIPTQQQLDAYAATSVKDADLDGDSTTV